MALLFVSLFILLTKSAQSVVPDCNGGSDAIKSLPGYTPNGNQRPNLIQNSGFVQVNKTANGSIFYWFIQTISDSMDENTPLLIWLNGKAKFIHIHTHSTITQNII